MVTVSIFTLRDVIRRVQGQYNTPANSNHHTSPSTAEDLKDVCDYLEQHELQTFVPQRQHNKYAKEARDLMAEGAAYANKANAFRNFQRDSRKATNKGAAEAAPNSDAESEDNNEYANPDIDGGADIDMDDLAMDEEEFPLGTDPSRFVAMAQEVIDELSKVCNLYCVLMSLG